MEKKTMVIKYNNGVVILEGNVTEFERKHLLDQFDSELQTAGILTKREKTVPEHDLLITSTMSGKNKTIISDALRCVAESEKWKEAGFNEIRIMSTDPARAKSVDVYVIETEDTKIIQCDCPETMYKIIEKLSNIGVATERQEGHIFSIMGETWSIDGAAPSTYLLRGLLNTLESKELQINLHA